MPVAVSWRSLVPLLLLALGCARIERTEVRTVGDVRRRPVRECHGAPTLRVARGEGGLIASAAQHMTCRSSTIEEWEVETKYKTRPNTAVFGLEIAAVAVGTALVVNAATCEEEGDFGCYGEGIGGLVGLGIAVPAAIATLVDATNFGSGTETSTEHAEDDLRMEDHGLRPMPGVRVTLALDNGGTASAITDDAGQALLPLPPKGAGEPEVVGGVLRLGDFRQRVRLR
jgi:hypothetical protein